MPEFDPDKFRDTKIAKERGGFSKEFLGSRSEAGKPAFNPQELEKLKRAKTTMTPVGQEQQRYPIGSTIGGIGASFTPYPNVTGTAGAFVGDIAQTGVEAALGRPHPKGLDILKSAGKEAGYQLGGGLAGKYAIKGLSRLAAPFAKSVMPEAPKTISYLETRGIKPGLLPAEATTSAIVDTAQNMAEHSILGQNGILLYKQNRQAALEKIGNDLVDTIGKKSSPEQAGQAFLQSVTGNLNVEKAKAGVLYNTVETMVKPNTVMVTKTELQPSIAGLVDAYGRPAMTEVTSRVKEEVGGVRPSLKGIKGFAAPLSKQAARLQGVEARNAGDDMMKAVMGMPDRLTFADAKALRSRLISFVDVMSIENKNAPAIGKARQVIKQLDLSMQRALQAQNPVALDMWREANRIYSKGQAQFNNSLIRRLSKSAMDDFGGNPEGVVKAVMKLGPSRIARVKAAVDAPTWAKFQNVAAQEVWKKGPDSLGVVRGSNLLNAIYGRTGLGEPSLKAVFTPTQIHTMTEFANALKMTQEKIGVNTGGMFIQMKQAGALVEMGGAVLSGTGHFGTGVPIMLGPAAMSHIMTHPVLSKWLIQGMTLPKGSQQAGQLAGRLLAAIPPRYLTNPTIDTGSVQSQAMPPTRQPQALAVQP